MATLEIYTNSRITDKQRKELIEIKANGGPSHTGGHKRGQKPDVDTNHVRCGTLIKNDVMHILGEENICKIVRRDKKGGEHWINVFSYTHNQNKNIQPIAKDKQPLSRAKESSRVRREDLDFAKYQDKLLELPLEKAIPVHEALDAISGALAAEGIEDIHPWQLVDFTPDTVSLKKLSAIDEALYRKTWKYVYDSENGTSATRRKKRLTAVEAVAVRIVNDEAKKARLLSVVSNY